MNISNYKEKEFITFENLSRVVTYSELVKKKESYKYLENICGFCREEYLGEEPVIIFPCTHALHESCFKAWDKNVCPYDQKNVNEPVLRVHLLGCEIFFQASYSDFNLGDFMKNIKEEINDSIHKLVIELTNKNLDELQEEDLNKIHEVGLILQSFIISAQEICDKMVKDSIFCEKISLNPMELQKEYSNNMIERLKDKENFDPECFKQFLSIIENKLADFAKQSCPLSRKEILRTLTIGSLVFFLTVFLGIVMMKKVEEML